MKHHLAIGSLIGGAFGLVVGWAIAITLSVAPHSKQPSPTAIDIAPLLDNQEAILRELSRMPSPETPHSDAIPAETTVSDELIALLHETISRLKLMRGDDLELIPNAVRTPKRIAEVNRFADAVALDRWHERNQVFGRSFASIMEQFGVPDRVRKDQTSGKTHWAYRARDTELGGVNFWFLDGIVVDVGQIP